MDTDQQKRKSILGLAFAEIVVVIIIALCVIGTLLYFKVISLPWSTNPSSTNQPTQAVSSSSATTEITPKNLFRVTQIIFPDKPFYLSNEINTTKYQYIASSSGKIGGAQGRIDIQLAANNATGSSGVIFDNGYKVNDSNYRAIRILRTAPNYKWIMQYVKGEQISSHLLTESISGLDFKNFTILIGPLGRAITVISPSFDSKVINLASSMYENTGGQISAFAQVASDSSLTIYSLNYQLSLSFNYPQGTLREIR